MTSVAEVEENAAAMERFVPMSAEEMAAAVKAMDEFSVVGKEFCTGCGYCEPCPNGVRISRLFRMSNYHRAFGLKQWARERALRIAPDKGPRACTECGECEPKCPNRIPIITQLKEVAALIEELKR